MSFSVGNPWKLGLFVVLGISSIVAAVFWLAAQRLNPEVLPAVTYFNESVEGIDVGSSIKIRGVKVGAVSDIDIAPDHRMVRVRMKIFVNTLEGLGLWPPPPEQVPIPGRLGPADLRLQLVSVGITGTKFIQADFFDPAQNPLPELSFEADPNYVPSIPSTLKSVGDALAEIAEALPRAVADFDQLVLTVQRSFEEARVADLAARLDSVLSRLDGELAGLEAGTLSSELVSLARETRATAASFQDLIDHLGDPGGPIEAALASWVEFTAQAGGSIAGAEVGETSRALRDASARVGEAAEAVRTLGRDADVVALGIEQDLASLRETLDALRALAVLLERDPGALLRGRAPTASHPLETDR